MRSARQRIVLYLSIRTALFRFNLTTLFAVQLRHYRDPFYIVVVSKSKVTKASLSEA